MGGVCTKAADQICARHLDHACGFSCQCMTCSGPNGTRCDCSCRWLVVAGFAIFILSSWYIPASLKLPTYMQLSVAQEHESIELDEALDPVLWLARHLG